MPRKSTRKDVAKLAGVSEATVSYVFNAGPKTVSKETEERVLQAAQELDYRPDLIARSLKTGKTQVIGLTIPIISSPMLSVLANIVHESLLEYGYTVTVVNTHEDPELEIQALDLLRSQSVDGLIACPVSLEAPDVLRQFKTRDVPVVFLDRRVTNFEADMVVTDNINCSQQATGYLAQQGCRRILCISFSQRASSAVDRVEGYKRGMKQHGLSCNEEQLLVVEDPTGKLVEAMFLAHIDAHGLPDGILCTTQEIGMGVLKAFKRRGIDFPAQKMVIFDAKWTQLFDPPLPTIEQDSRSMAETAVQLLVKRLDGDTSPFRTVFFDARLIIS